MPSQQFPVSAQQTPFSREQNNSAQRYELPPCAYIELLFLRVSVCAYLELLKCSSIFFQD